MCVFKTKWFTKAARSHAIQDSELCLAIEAVKQEKGDDLGGESIKSALIITEIELSSWLKVERIGSILFSTLNRLWRISVVRN